jgi:hypothetical protein
MRYIYIYVRVYQYIVRAYVEHSWLRVVSLGSYRRFAVRILSVHHLRTVGSLPPQWKLTTTTQSESQVWNGPSTLAGFRDIGRNQSSKPAPVPYPSSRHSMEWTRNKLKQAVDVLSAMTIVYKPKSKWQHA